MQLKNQLVLTNAQHATTQLNLDRGNEASSAKYELIISEKDKQLQEVVRNLLYYFQSYGICKL